MTINRVMAVAISVFVIALGAILIISDSPSDGAVGDTFAVNDAYGNNIGYIVTVDDDTSKEVDVKLTTSLEATTVSIPSTVSHGGVTYTVTGIADWGFDDSTIGTLTLPDTLKTIGYEAFYGTSISGNLVIPAGVNLIDTWAFEYIEVTGDITIGEPSAGETLTIKGNVFSSAEVVGKVNLPAGIGSMVYNSFDGLVHGGLTMTASETSKYYLQNGLFIERGNGGAKTVVAVDPLLDQIDIPSDVTAIGDSAFYSLDAEISGGLTIPANVKSIGSYAFAYVNISGPLVLNEGLESIGSEAFYDCDGFTSVTVPASVTSIGNYAFQNCNGLTEAVLSEGITSISNNMFDDCTALESVTIPSTVTSIGSSAFENCSSLESELNLP
ncbi:MAG: leucine-rich repeat protein, partial [Candidatus Methanomethylophilaceae archaeon]|nr:leucine-rich repeat protein [Candidatus Methanomethylophilaceae archaeon]